MPLFSFSLISRYFQSFLWFFPLIHWLFRRIYLIYTKYCKFSTFILLLISNFVTLWLKYTICIIFILRLLRHDILSKGSAPFPPFSPSGTPIMLMSGPLMVSHKSVRYSPFFFFLLSVLQIALSQLTHHQVCWFFLLPVKSAIKPL